MNPPLFTIERNHSQSKALSTNEALHALESGQIIYFPAFCFALQNNELPILCESILDSRHKNISYDYRHNRIAGLSDEAPIEPKLMAEFMHRFALFAKTLIDETFPEYSEIVHWGRTSYRPAEIKGRKTSKRKDDTRLHVDSFSATPVNGLRILRVFCNINPSGEPRVWHVGEPFTKVLEQFAPHIPPYQPIKAKLLKWLKATKTLRSAYDHYMLHLHDGMKLNDHYQQEVTKQRIDFPTNSTWIVFTDHVSHAALSGQYLLEQTFYLPVSAMRAPELSPLKQWEKKKSKVLA